jgi:hypothetical protein
MNRITYVSASPEDTFDCGDLLLIHGNIYQLNSIGLAGMILNRLADGTPWTTVPYNPPAGSIYAGYTQKALEAYVGDTIAKVHDPIMIQPMERYTS